MGGAVLTYYACSVKGKYQRQLLKRRIVYKLVVGALGKGAVYRKHGVHTPCRKPCAKGKGVLLRYAYVKKSILVLLCKGRKSRPVTHCGGNGAKPLIGPASAHHDITENRGKAAACFKYAALGYTVVFFRRLLSRSVTLALYGANVYYTALLAANSVTQNTLQTGYIVAVHGAVVVYPQILKHIVTPHKALYKVFNAPCRYRKGSADKRDGGKKPFKTVLKAKVSGAGAKPAYIAVYTAHVVGYRHFVIVKYNYNPQVLFGNVVKSLVYHTARKGAVTCNGNGKVLFACQCVCCCKAHCRRNRGACVACAKAVVLAFSPLGEPGKTAVGAYAFYFLVSARKHLVNVSLMADVPYYPVLRRG